jgi:hypothetical protein
MLDQFRSFVAVIEEATLAGIWMSRGNVDELMVVEGAARDPTVVLETNSPWK